MARRGLLIILSSPSGAGKSTLAKALRKWDDTLRFSVSATTSGKWRLAVCWSTRAFSAITMARPRGRCRRPSSPGAMYCLTLIGLQDHVLSIFILPPSITELHRRLVSRGQDDAEVIEQRMQKSWDEISHWDGYDYVLVNDDLAATEEKLKTIITAERLRASQQPALVDHVRDLQTQFEER